MSRIRRAVSLYSFQDEYVRGDLDLEGMFKLLSDNNIDGAEIISDQMLTNAPNVSDQEIVHLKYLSNKYNVELVCNDVYVNSQLYKNRELTKAENLALLEAEIELAHRMGINLIRLVSMTPNDIIKDALPLCEKLGVTMALEIHAGMSFDNPMTKEFCDIMFEVDSPYLGLVVDTGIFARRHPRVSTEFFLDQGLSPKIAEYIDSLFADGGDPKGKNHPNQVPAEIAAEIKGQTDFEYLIFSDGYENSPFTILDKYMPYVKHFHGKFFEIMDDGQEYSIDFPGFFEYIASKNFKGYVASEYEGGRFALPGEQVNAVDQVLKHQELMEKCIKEVE